MSYYYCENCLDNVLQPSCVEKIRAQSCRTVQDACPDFPCWNSARL
jgi:hypothetical protein